MSVIHEMYKRDAEIERLQDENAQLKAELAGYEPVHQLQVSTAEQKRWVDMSRYDYGLTAMHDPEAITRTLYKKSN